MGVDQSVTQRAHRWSDPTFPSCYSQVDAVVVGADRVVANGDTANKIGTYALSIIAKHHKVQITTGSFSPPNM